MINKEINNKRDLKICERFIELIISLCKLNPVKTSINDQVYKIIV
jgi:hypothetical protein